MSRTRCELVDTAEGDISLYTQGDFTDLCRGPHLQNSKPIKALKLTGLAGAYWRGDSTQPQLTRIYGTAFYSQEDLDAHLERLEEARKRDHRMLGQRLDLFHFDEHSPGSAFWHPKGMVIWNELEALRRRENARRGYVEVKTPLIYDKALWVTSGHWEKFRENMFLIPLDDDQVYGIKPMNCPGHMLLFGETLRSYRELPLRYAEAAPLHRNELAGRVARPDARPPRHPGRRAHLLHAGADPGGARRLHRLSAASSTASSGSSRAPSSRRGPDDKLGSDEEWDFTEGALEAALERNEIEYVVGEGEGAFYGPKIDLHVTDVLGRSWQIGTIQLDRQMPQRFGLTYMGPDNTRAPGVRHPPRALRLVRALHRHPDRALRRRVPVLARAGADPVLPVGEGHLERRARDRREAESRLPGRHRRADRDDRQADPGARAREDPVHDRLRRPRERGRASPSGSAAAARPRNR